ncbi:MAG: hypothetical protein D6753_08260, partial [Planctomycetota bacterium]
TIRAPTATLARLRVGELTPEQIRRWQAITESVADSDVLVVRRPDGQLTSIAGLVQGFGPDAVQFDLDGQTIPVPWERLAGVRFFHANEPELAAPRAVVHDSAGGRWLASQIRFAPGDKALGLVLQCGVTVDLGLEELAEIDFSVGTMKSLVDLPPLASSATEGFGFRVPVPGVDALFGPRVVTGTAGGAAQEDRGIEFLGGGEIAYRLPAGFSRLVGAVELRPEGQRFTPVVFRILVDSDVVWEVTLDQPHHSVSFDVPIRDDARLKLEARPRAEVPLGAVVLVHQPRLLR